MSQEKFRSKSPIISVASFYEKEDRLAINLTNTKIESDLYKILNYFKIQINQLTNDLETLKNPKIIDGLLFNAIMLRRLGRLSNFRNRLLHERLANSRTKVETHFLQLQNIKSEISHLKKAIDNCLEFQSSDSDIDLVSVNEFYDKAPELIKNTEVTKLDSHQLHLARLTFELEERKCMLGNLQELEHRKSLLLSDIRGKEQRLQQVKPKIVSLKQNAKPLLEILGLKNLDTPAFEAHKKFQHLPMQLELLSLSANVYNELFHESLEIFCEGDVQKILTLTNIPPVNAKISIDDSTIGINYNENSDEEIDFGEKEEEFDEDAFNKRHRKLRKLNEKNIKQNSSLINKLEFKKETLLHTYPISLCLVIPISIQNQPNIKLKISFVYLTELKCVGVKCKFLNNNFNNNWQIIDTENLLDELYKSDFGRTCGNRIKDALLKKLDIKINNYTLLIGKPYSFAQKLCGLFNSEFVFTANQSLMSKSQKILKKSQLSDFQVFELFSNFIDRVRHRVTTRFFLVDCLKQIDQSKNTQILTKSLRSQIPSKVLSYITTFTSITVENALGFSNLSGFQRNLLNRLNEGTELLLDTGFLYKATIERSNFLLQVLIYVPTNYPHYSPVFFLIIENEKYYTCVELINGIKELEKFLNVTARNWLNIICINEDNQSIIKNEILSFQLALLCSRLDVILELTTYKILESEDHEKIINFELEHYFQGMEGNNNQQYPFAFDDKSNSFLYNLLI